MTFSPFAFSGLILAATCLFLVFVIIKSARSRAHFIWAYFNISVALWGVASFFMLKDFGPEAALFWIRFGHCGVVFISVFFFHLVCLVCNLKRQKLIIFSYIQGCLFCVLLWTNFFITFDNVGIIFNEFYYDQSHGYIYPLFFTIWLGFILYGHFELFKSYLFSKGIKRNQILYFFFGMVVGFSGGLTNFFPVFGLSLYPIGNFTIPIYCVIVSYAILKYQLLDIRMAVTKTGIFVAVYSLVLGVPFAIAFLWQHNLIGILGENW